MRKSLVTALAASVCIIVPATSVQAQARQYNIAAGSLKSALDAYARQSGRQIIYKADDLGAARSPGVRGSLSDDAALLGLLRGTSFSYRADASGAVAIVAGEADAGSAPADQSADIVVTGSHIRGETPSAPPKIFSRNQIQEQGFRDLGEVARSIPQNFNGGQNPSVAGGGNQGSGNENSSSSSALNLRGLGPAATLTLMNGHRLAYDTVGQGVDLSQIPVNAIDRLEVLTDGSSALYGADAIGGVANVILRRDYDGLLASAQLGGSTDGGNTRQQYDVVTGRRWSSGGFMVAGSYSDISAITAGQRDYTRTLNRTATLVPSQRQISGVLAGRQKLTDNLTIMFDGNFSQRRSETANAVSTTADVQTNGLLAKPKVTSATANISVQWDVGGSWLITAGGTHGISRNHVSSRRFVAGAEAFRSALAYDNSVTVAEIGAEGSVLSLPGGDARLAIGGGYRDNGLDVLIRRTTAGTTATLTNLKSGRDVFYGYGELSLPFVGSGNARPLLRQLHINLAARYERYPSEASLLTPKVGVVYSPFDGLLLRGNWGKSFRTQTLFQQFQARQGILLPSSIFQSPPSTAPILIVSGGNPNLRPERADTWSLGTEIAPTQIPGLSFEVTYFGIAYRDRIVSPFLNLLGAFVDPVYRNYITLTPSSALVSDIVATLPQGLSNQTGTVFNPAAVGAYVDASLQNAARQRLHGLDLNARYRIALSGENFVRLDASASYLKSNQQLSAGRPSLPLAGTIFNPPHWRARAGGTWQQDQVTLAAFGSHIGGTRDTRFTPEGRVGSFTSFDVSGQLRTAVARGPFSGIVLGASVLNLFNEKPAVIRNPIAVDPPYDSTNYPVAGRVITLLLSKAF